MNRLCVFFVFMLLPSLSVATGYLGDIKTKVELLIPDVLDLDVYPTSRLIRFMETCDSPDYIPFKHPSSVSKVYVNISCESGLRTRFSLELSGNLPVLTPLVKIKRGVVIGDSMGFEVKNMPLDSLRSGYISKQLTSGYYKAKRDLKSGEPIYKDYLSVAPLVEAGSEVLVQFFSTRMSISSVAIAKETGHLNDFIKVMNPYSGKSYMVKITGRNKVKLK